MTPLIGHDSRDAFGFGYLLFCDATIQLGIVVIHFSQLARPARPVSAGLAGPRHPLVGLLGPGRPGWAGLAEPVGTRSHRPQQLRRLFNEFQFHVS